MWKGQKRVLVALGWYDYRLHRGIEKYAQEQGWHLSADVTREHVIPWGWNGDGILAWLGAGDELAEFVVRTRKPTVDFSYRRPHLKFPHVLVDNDRIAQLAAEHFLTRGFRHFVYFSDRNNWAFEERGAAFVKILRAAGHDCTWLRWQEAAEYYPGGRVEEWKRRRKWLGVLLKKSPRPLAVFTANDDHALEILETAENVGLTVPEQVAIVGVDNSLLAVEAMRTPISTVETNMEAVGYQGAALLDKLMRGKPAPSAPLRVPPTGLITRKSSDLLAINHKGVANCMRFIAEHYHERIGILDLAKAAAMSRRAFYTAFVQHVGRTPGEELHRVRIHRAKQLLTESDHKMETVASLCGYQSANSFWVSFKQAVGQSPKQYRDTLKH